MRGAEQKWGDQELLDAIKRWADEHEGRPPRWVDWERAIPGYPTSFTVRIRCGSWNDALEMAGFSPNQGVSTSKISDELIAKGKKLHKQGKNNTEIARELNISLTTVKRRIGPSVPRQNKPRNADERREARVAALRRALEKNN